MKNLHWYIQYIEQYAQNKTEHKRDWYSRWYISEPEEATWLLKLKIRIIQAYCVLTGKAIAVKFHKKSNI